MYDPLKPEKRLQQLKDHDAKNKLIPQRVVAWLVAYSKEEAKDILEKMMYEVDRLDEDADVMINIRVRKGEVQVEVLHTNME